MQLCYILSMFMWKKFLLGLAHLKGSHPLLLDGKVTPKSQRFCPHLWKLLRLGQDRNSKNESLLFEYYSLFLKTPKSLYLPKKYDLHVHKHLYLPKVCKKCVPGIFPGEQNLRRPPKWSLKPKQKIWHLSFYQTHMVCLPLQGGYDSHLRTTTAPTVAL